MANDFEAKIAFFKAQAYKGTSNLEKRDRKYPSFKGRNS